MARTICTSSPAVVTGVNQSWVRRGGATCFRKTLEEARGKDRFVVHGYVVMPERWPWSSFRAYFYGETGPVRVKSQEWAMEIKRRPVESFAEVGTRWSGAPVRNFFKNQRYPGDHRGVNCARS